MKQENKDGQKLWDDLCNNCNIDISLSDYKTAEELIDYVNDNNLCNEDVIYYYNAMKYLSENDNSLMESIELADEIGYETKNINSELLATLLKSRKNQEAFYDMQSEIEEYYNNLEEN